MGINSIKKVEPCNRAFNSNKKNKSKDEFIKKLKNSVTGLDDHIVMEIDNEPFEDREEDLKLYNALKKYNFDFKNHSFRWAKENCKLIAFPPITVPGHLRGKFKEYINDLDIKEKEKRDVGFSITVKYALYIKENPKDIIKSYTAKGMENLVTNLLIYNEKYKKINEKLSIIKYENTRLILNKLLDYINTKY
ncbi:hypothetical protein [Clostridium felsineum]|uniref:hypothetical protein n=1 Tax=Clostridium felsineum TaxID=36839 RepID=UPI00098CEA73|nr:hypothetical protein [Clostridium felsineum]URZ04570.1 hypothetical protein CLAUR_046590 [Clostridium felsineum]